jgi:hypothetical protein
MISHWYCPMLHFMAKPIRQAFFSARWAIPATLLLVAVLLTLRAWSCVEAARPDGLGGFAALPGLVWPGTMLPSVLLFP